jgi:SAM-dependent methyltransferase
VRERAPTERTVEIPWALARYRGEQRVLDVGSAWTEEEEYLKGLAALGAAHLVGIDAALPPRGQLPFELVQADVRQLPFAGSSFELVFCISTLEHIGFDNSVYGLSAERDPAGMAKALRELRRVLTVDGRLLVTVPCGELEDHGWFLQQPPDYWLALFGGAGFDTSARDVYELSRRGRWRRRRWFRAKGVRYGARGPAASAVLCAELLPRP